MAEIEHTWWRLEDGVPVVLTKVAGGFAYWEAFDGSKGRVKEPAFIRGFRRVRLV